MVIVVATWLISSHMVLFGAGTNKMFEGHGFSLEYINVTNDGDFIYQLSHPDDSALAHFLFVHGDDISIKVIS